MSLRLTSLFVFLSFFGFTQDYEVRISNITDENGIDVPSTFGIAEDNLGFIWFGTVGGLYRYDGYRMKVFRIDEDNPNSISSNTIRALLYDSIRNQLYVGTQFGGLNILDLNKQQFTKFIPDINKPDAISNNSIWSLMLDKHGKLWLGMENNQLNIFDPDKKQFRNVKLVSQDNNQFKGSCTIRSLFQDKAGNIWVGTDNHGLYMIDSYGIQAHFYEEYHNKNALKNNFVTSVCNDNNGNFWMATFGAGVAKFNVDKGYFNHIANRQEENKGPISGLAYSIIADDENNLWIGTEYGLSVMNTETYKAKHYVQQFSSNEGLTDNRIRKLFRDSNGILWIGTEAGVDKLVQQSNFKSFKHKSSNTNSIPGGIVRAIYKDADDVLWIGLIDKGLVSYNDSTRIFTHFINHDEISGDIICYQVSAILEDSEGNFWIGDWEKGLLKFDRKKKKYTYVLSAFFGNPKLLDNRVQSIKEDGKGILWLGTESGIVRFDYKNNQIEYLTHNPKRPNSLSGNAVQAQALEIDYKGNLWAGTWANGLNYVEIKQSNPLKYKVHRYLKTDEDQFLSNNNVISLYQQGDSILWVGTFGGGLNKFNINTKRIKHYDIADGLPNNIIFAIKPGSANTLWLSTDYGLSKFNYITNEFTNFDATDGLQDEHFFWGAAYQAINGEIYFGGINGLNNFHPEDVVNQKVNKTLVLTDIRVSNKSLPLETPYEKTNFLNLPYYQNYLSFDFALLDYVTLKKRKFKVKLVGLDTDWKDIGNQQTVNYPNLKPGNYKLKIVLQDGNTKAIDSIKEIEIIINSPWYLKWWSISIYVLTFISLLYSIYAIRIKVLLVQKRNLAIKIKERTQEIVAKSTLLAQQNEEISEQKEELAEKNSQLSEALEKISEIKEKAIQSEKMASLGVLAAGVAHEINNPLNYIQGGVFGIEQNLVDNKCGHANQNRTFLNAIKEGVSRVVAIVSSLDQFSRENESLAESCNIKQIVNNCFVILSSQLKNRISVENKMQANIDYLVKGSQGKLHQAFLNIITNAEQAIKNKGLITIDAIHEGDKIKISIIDNGKGIQKEVLHRITEPFFTTKDPGEGTGLGLSLSYRIIQEHGGQLLFESEVGKGTKVDVILPIGQ